MRGIRVFGQNAFRSIGQSGGASSYADKVKTIFGSSLIDYRRLNEGSGTSAFDSSPKAHAAGTISGATWTPGAGFDGGPALLFDGVNDYTDIYSAGLNTDFNGQELTIVHWYKVSSAGVLTDASARRLFTFSVDGSNFIQFRRTSTDNQFLLTYVAGGTTKSPTFLLASSAWVCFAVTISKSNDALILYVNGVTSGTTTGLGTWTGSLLSSQCVWGAGNNSGGNAWSGYLRDGAIGNVALTAAQIAQLAVQ